ncbi:hypothetical protein CIG19_08580 [Enterobacterales bacterium CwR94]|nr:hypothetical protein CIG19_08580 [Enterobacterales bacterium CwR94]
MKSLTAILLASVVSASSFASEIKITLINKHSDAGIWVNKAHFEDCEPHPTVPVWCILPPNSESTMTQTLDDEDWTSHYRDFRLVSMENNSEGRPELLSGATITHQPAVPFTSLVCNTLGESSKYAVRISADTSPPLSFTCFENERNVQHQRVTVENIIIAFDPELDRYK